MEAVLAPIKRQNRHFHLENAISLFAYSWTLVGHSSDSSFSIDNANFIASNGTNYD